MVELVRSWQYLGGPWGLMGASQWQVAPALRLASIGGVWLVSFLVVFVNTCVTALVATPAARRPAVAALAGGGGGHGRGVAVGAAGPGVRVGPDRRGAARCRRYARRALRPRGRS